MNHRAQEFTRHHYDGHANKHQTQEEALRSRQQGPGLPLKKFHNNVKRQLINRFAQGAGSLLDLACGRGGDLWKWIDANIQYVKGMDLSPHEVQEAQKRYREAMQSRPDVSLHAEFEATEHLGRQEVKLGSQFDVVTCMFAIHYFFASKQALGSFFHNVSINLKQGGYFFGTVPDGRTIQDTIYRLGKWPSYDKPMLKVKACWEGEVTPFGCGYTCAIGDTVTEGHGDSSGSYEYLVYRSVLEGVAQEHGFEAITDYGDPKLEQLFEWADRKKCCKHFAPNFPRTGDEEIDSSLQQASRLNMAFVFRKRKESEATRPVKRPREEAVNTDQPLKRQNIGNSASTKSQSREAEESTESGEPVKHDSAVADPHSESEKMKSGACIKPLNSTKSLSEGSKQGVKPQNEGLLKQGDPFEPLKRHNVGVSLSKKPETKRPEAAD